MVDFAEMMRNSNMLDDLVEETKKLDKGGFQKDDRYWQPVKDSSGKADAIIRFLPPPPFEGEEKTVMVKRYNYGFKGPTGQWYIENSPSTLGLPDPVMEANSLQYNSGTEEGKKIASKRKRKTQYISNILVVKHEARKSDEGKVFLFAYGIKVHNKIMDKMNPDDEDVKKWNPFDPLTGANFRLRIRNVEGFPNYEKSEFDERGPISKDQDVIEEIWKRQYSLKAEVAPDKFKSYDDLMAQFKRVWPSERITSVDSDDLPWEAPKQERAASPRRVETASADDEDTAFFDSLAED